MAIDPGYLRGARAVLGTTLILLGLCAGASARAETFHTCKLFIASLPATITTGGVYCLDHDLSTGITSGIALSIDANNVTLDCNGYKIGGLAGGTLSTAAGIRALGRQNITVRNCGLRGFNTAIALTGNGMLVEYSRVDQALRLGIGVAGLNNMIRHCQVYDTGGYAAFVQSIFGIVGGGDVIDNTVAGVFTSGTQDFTVGISVSRNTRVVNNRVRGLVNGDAFAVAYGIDSRSALGAVIAGNRVHAPATTVGWGIHGHSTAAEDDFCQGNFIAGFATAMQNCRDSGGNDSF